MALNTYRESPWLIALAGVAPAQDSLMCNYLGQL